MDGSPPGSSVHGISQAGILEWVAISISRGSSQPRDRTHISCIGRWILYHWTSREALLLLPYTKISLCTTWMIPLHLVLCLEILLYSFGETHWIVHLKWLNFLLIITQRGWLTKPTKQKQHKLPMCMTPYHPMDCSPPGNSVRWISQAGILEWVAISFSKGSSQLSDWTPISCIGRQILNN